MRKGISAAICGLFILFVSSCTIHDNGDTALDVVALRDKSPKEVIDLNGNPDSSYNHSILGKQFLIYRYDPHQVEMRFFQNKLAEIIVHDPRPWPFEPETIEHFGMDYFEPTASNPGANISWSNYGGYWAVSMYLVGREQEDTSHANYEIYFNNMRPQD